MLKFNLQLFASKKGVGSSKNGRDSLAKRLGVKSILEIMLEEVVMIHYLQKSMVLSALSPKAEAESKSAFTLSNNKKVPQKKVATLSFF